MNSGELFEYVKGILVDLGRSQISRPLAAQMLLDALHRIDLRAKDNSIGKAEKNRHFVLLSQHLSMLLRSPGHRSIRNRFQRGNLLLNSDPYLVVSGIDFSGLSLPNFYLSDTTIVSCTFRGADLRGAKLLRCELQGCSFGRSDLANADFRGSTLYGCEFEDANIRNAKGIV